MTMALTKIINDGDELVFDLSDISPAAWKEISIILVKRCRPANILIIRADRSIPIRHIKQQNIYQGAQEESDMPSLPVYRCHKLVQAAKITRIEPLGGEESISVCNSAVLHFGEIQQGLTVNDAYLQKHKPEVGGYYVIYDDDYRSYSPAKAFESGYTKL